MGEKNGSLFNIVIVLIAAVAIMTIAVVMFPSMMTEIQSTISSRLSNSLSTVGMALLGWK